MRRPITVLLVPISFILAAGFGKIKGIITEGTTGTPMVSVNIVVDGTPLGSATDASGEYVISFVPVGRYSVSVSYVGYNTVRLENVRVISGQTSVIDLSLDPMVIVMEPVVTVAKKPIVIRSQSQTMRTVHAEDLNRLPISDINQVVVMQAGVSQSELGTHIRGGRDSEIAYYVDGILTKAPHYSGQSAKVNKEAVEEIDMITGGFEVEYGEAMSGVVNIVTREGSERTTGQFRYTTDEMFLPDHLNYGYNFYEACIGGRLGSVPRVRYFVSGEALVTDVHELGKYKVPSERFEHKLSGNLSYRLPGNKGRVTLSGFYSREQFTHFKDLNGDLSFVYHLDHNTAEVLKNYLLTLRTDYLLSENTLIELKVGRADASRFHAVRDMEEESRLGRAWYEEYVFKASHFPALLRSIDDDSVIRSYLIDSLCDPAMPYHYEEMDRSGAPTLRNCPFGATEFFYTIGDNRIWRYLYNTDYQAVISMTNLMGGHHELKTGLSLLAQNVGWFDNNLPFYRLPFWDMYDKNPLKAAFYAQDVIDFKGIVARIGMRLDLFDSQAEGLANPGDYDDTTTIRTPLKWRVSPRLGASFPITERSKLRFNYGHFYQIPTAHDLYRATEPDVVWMLLHRYNSVLGNPNLSAEKTVAYELGYENQMSDVIAAGIVLYYKDIYDLIQSRKVLAFPYAYHQVFNADYGNVKGVEFTVKKIMGEWWGFDLSYTLQYAKGTASYAWQFYYEGGENAVGAGATGISLPYIDYWLNFDERHIVNANLRVDVPGDFLIMPMRRVTADFIVSYHSGFPYTPEYLKSQYLGNQNSARMPSYLNIDAKFTKTVNVMGVGLSFFVNIFNLLDTEQITSVYSTTGLPGDDGGSTNADPSDFSVTSLSSPYYTPQADYDHDGLNSAPELCSEYLKARAFYYDNPFHWKPGFRAQAGFGLRF